MCLLSLETLFFHFLCSRVSIFACVSVVVKLNNKKQEHECVQLTIVNNSASAVALLALYKRRGGGGEEVGEVGRRWGGGGGGEVGKASRQVVYMLAVASCLHEYSKQPVLWFR